MNIHGGGLFCECTTQLWVWQDNAFIEEKSGLPLNNRDCPIHKLFPTEYFHTLYLKVMEVQEKYLN